MTHESLIDQLTDEISAVRIVRPLRVCMETLILLIINVSIMVAVQGLRDDMVTTLSQPAFIMEMLCNAVLVSVAAYAATIFAYPEKPSATPILMILGLSFTAYSAVIGWAVFVAPEHAHAHHYEHGLACSKSIASFVILPALWLAWRLRKLATTAPAMLGGMVLLVATASGCLGVRFVEHEAISESFLVWHYLPLLLSFLVGYAAGGKFFRW